MSAQKPAIVIAHGAWHVPAHYEPMAKPLREAGHEVIIPQHQSVGRGKVDSGNTLQEDATAIAEIIRQLLAGSTDVVLFMHSYGGIAGSDAIGILAGDGSLNKGPGKVRRLVYLAAHIIDKDVTFFGSRGQIPNVDTDKDGMTTHMKPYERYYHEVSLGDAEPALALLQPMAASAFTSSISYGGLKNYGIPCTFITCSQDTAVSPDMCNKYIARAREAGIEMVAETIDAGHCAHFTAPSLVIGVLEKIL